MKKIVIVILLLMFDFAVNAAEQPAGKVAPTAPAVKAQDETKREHNFEDLLVQGKYHFSDEAVTTVEEDKVLDSLLGIRAEFKDRMEKSAGQY